MPRGLWAPFPWREAAHLAFGLPAGLALLVALALTVLFSPLVVFAPVAALAPALGLALVGRLEPVRFEAVLGEVVPTAPISAAGTSLRDRWQNLLADPGFRRLAGYAFVRAPLSVLELGVFTAVFTWPLVLLASAARAVFGGLRPSAGPFAVDAWGAPATGFLLVVLLVAVVTVVGPLLVRQLVRLDLTITRALLAVPDVELVRRVGELAEARDRVVSSAEAERSRIERDLHDGAQQRLIALGVSLGRAEARLRRDDPDGDTLTLVAGAKAEAMGVVADIRALTRGLRPPILESRGLDAALSAVASRLSVPAEIQVTVERLAPPIEAVLYFALTECLTNVAKHAPGARATVRVDRHGPLVRAEVRDSGPGGVRLDAGSGLSGIADRLAGVDGRLWLSSPPGGPTIVRMELPCAS